MLRRLVSLGLVLRTMRGKLSAALGISRSSSYYQHVLPINDDELLVRITDVMRDNTAYGYERIAIALNEGKERVRRVMRSNNLKPSVRRGKAWEKPPAVSLEQELQNLIAAKSVLCPSHVWAGDFTYMWFMGRWYYLATVIDLYTREIVGWQLGRRSKAQLIHLAYCDGLSNHPPPRIFHADRGSQYTAKATRQLYYYNHQRIHTAIKTNPVQYRKNYLAVKTTD